MANIRILYNDHVASNPGTITASTTEAGFAATSMRNDRKSSCHRSTSNTVTYTLTWLANRAATVSGVVLPATSLSAGALIKVILKLVGGVVAHDTGWLPACPGFVKDPRFVRNVNAFPYGQCAKVAVWLPETFTAIRSVEIYLDDSASGSAFIDCSRIVLGTYMEPNTAANYNANQWIEDMSTTRRSETGDNLTNRKPMFDKLSMNFDFMDPEDRAEMAVFFQRVGKNRNVFIDMFPDEDVDPQLRHDWMIYGKRADNSQLNFTAFNLHTTQLQIDGW